MVLLKEMDMGNSKNVSLKGVGLGEEGDDENLGKNIVLPFEILLCAKQPRIFSSSTASLTLLQVNFEMALM